MIQYERVRAEIDLDAFASNIKEVKKNISKNTRIMSVVKADGYGHGAYETALTALESGATLLGVAIPEEGVSLRERGITAPIVIFGACFKSQINSLLDYDLEQTVFSLKTAAEINEAAKRLGKQAKIHIKIDTGMGRIGFLPTTESVDEIAEIFKLENIDVMGIYSHFSCSDHEDKTYSHMQNERFSRMISFLTNNGIALPPLHLSNSGAIIDMREMNYDIVRAGIMQYGLFPSRNTLNKDKFKLLPVMSVKACVSHVKIIKKGECVGYNAGFKAERDTIVATIPVGYADGYSRKMRNNGRVIINGEYAPVIGSVCMDQFMVDVTGMKDVKAGDTAVLLGEQKSREITAYELAEICDTIPYEIVCAFSKRVPRVYMRRGKNQIL